MHAKQPKNIIFFSVIFSLFFLAYFSFLSEKLPTGAGPDEKAHIQAATFIYENERLAVFPDDKDQLYYSIYGATRSFRPPLTYITSAAVVALADNLNINFTQPYRKANAILGALSAFFLLLALYIYTQKLGLSVLITSSFLLMPQVSFIFSYLNTEGSAFMAGSLVLLSAVCLLRNINYRTLAFFGFACGILSLSKITAWVFCFPVCLFCAWCVLRSKLSLAKPILIVFAVFIITAGWRIGFNVYHHGIENPFNWSLDKQISQQYTRVNLEKELSYGKLDKGYLDLLSNYDNFLARTFISTVGHLDWLRLKMGPMQYLFFASLFLLILCSSLWTFYALIRQPKDKQRDNLFRLSIIVGSLLLFYFYMQFNINLDIQTQGKYILPAYPGLLVLLAGFIAHCTKSFNFSTDIKKYTLVFMFSALIYVHAQALYKYVIPFYHGSIYTDTQAERFTPLNLFDHSKVELDNQSVSSQTPNQISYTIKDYDPKIFINDADIDTQPQSSQFKIHLNSDFDGYYQLYWDDGTGFSEVNSALGFKAHGDFVSYVVLPQQVIKNLRFDFGQPNRTYSIKEISYAPYKTSVIFKVLNKIFFYNPLEQNF